MAIRQWSFGEQLLHLRNYVADAGRRAHFSKCVDRIRQQIRKSNWKDQDIGEEMDSFGGWLVASGLLEVAEDNIVEGWALVHNGFRWRFWGHWITVERHCGYAPSRRGRSWPLASYTIDEIGFLFLFAYATRDDTIARTLGDWLTWLLDSTGLRGWDWKWPIHSFCLEVYKQWTIATINLPRPLPAFGPYESLIAHLSDPARFEMALLEVADYHCERASAEVDDDCDDPYYCEYPELVVPLEIVAVRRLRMDQRLPFPQPRHALFDTPWYRTFPTNAPDVMDSALDEVKSYFAQLIESATRSGNR